MPDGREIFGCCTSVSLSTGKSINIRGLGLGDYASIRDEALRSFRRDKIKVYTENSDLIPETMRDGMVREAFERAEKIGVDDLPEKLVVKYAPEDIEKPKAERAVVAAQRVEYPDWWMGEDPRGMLFAIWLASKEEMPGITAKQVEELFRDEEGRLNLVDLEKVGKEVGLLSQPKIVGNGDAPRRENSEGRTARESRRRRRQKK